MARPREGIWRAREKEYSAPERRNTRPTRAPRRARNTRNTLVQEWIDAPNHTNDRFLTDTCAQYGKYAPNTTNRRPATGMCTQYLPRDRYVRTRMTHPTLGICV
jgi:hypothetical protein